MHFESNHLYHIYNLGINTQPIFFSEKNYRFFLSKIRIEWMPYTNILGYCLLPNEFHFILQPNRYGTVHLAIWNQLSPLQQLSRTIGSTLSSYTKAINIEQNRVGGLFHKKTKHLELDASFNSRLGYSDPAIRLTLIHQKPVKKDLCTHPSGWKFSSFNEYANPNKKGICRTDIIKDCAGVITT
jgi:putative transposase